jgi:hypothetical protein
MAKCKWVFEINGKNHEVLLKFGLFSGRQILLDGNLINKGRNTFEMGSEFQFLVDDYNADLGIVSTATGYEYYLRINNEFVFPSNTKNKKIGKSTSKIFEERQKWENLGAKHEMKYCPLSNTPFAFRHRLIGYIQNFLVIIGVGSRRVGDNSIPGFYIQIRHAPIDSERSKDIKSNEIIKKTLKEMKVSVDWLEINPELSSLFITSGFKKASEIEAVERLFSFFYVISPFLRPALSGKCEGAECKSPFYKDLTLTLINGLPYAMCDECIDRIEDITKRAEEEYKNQPSNLLKGSLYGLAATTLGAIVWALVFIFLDRIGAVFAVLIFFIVVKAMDYAKTKRTFVSLMIASLLALAGSIAGTYIGIAGYLFKKGELELTLNGFIELAKFLLEEPELINQTIVFALVGLVPYLFITWSGNRKIMNLVFKPDVELVKSFELIK